MNATILAINFGHDASLALFADGQLLAFRELERFTRLKHSVGIAAHDLRGFLVDAGYRFDDVDAVAVCGTQWWNAKHETSLLLTPGYDAAVFGKLAVEEAWTAEPELQGTDQWYCYDTHAARLKSVSQTAFPLSLAGALPHLRGIPRTARDFEELQGHTRRWLALDRGTEARRQLAGTIHPYVIQLNACAKPAFYVPHHLAHAGYGAYYLPHGRQGIVVSHDGGWPHLPCNAGGVYLATGHGVYPLFDPQLFVGQLYQRWGEIAGFHPAEAPGKLMGLASYGHPAPGADAIVARLLEQAAAGHRWTLESFEQALRTILDEGAELSRQHRGTLAAADSFTFAFADRDFSITLAATAQFIVESVWEQALTPALAAITEDARLAREIPVVGGFALNCPANSRLQQALPTLRLRPLPGGGDMGTALGAGAIVATYLTGERPAAPDGESPAFPPRRQPSPLQTLAGVEAFVPAGDIADWYAAELAAGRVFCHVESDSEVGPRALGHRSIIAHGVSAARRDFVNRQKRRELWRPLAPLVRAGDFERYFAGTADSAEFMLFTYPVVSPDIPAVTHVDASARAQAIRGGILHDVLSALAARGEVPVLINTSFNVAGEPIVETTDEAVRSFLALGFDYLYLDGRLYRPAAQDR